VTPAAGFRPFFNPATGEWITYTAVAEDNGGQLVRFTWRSVPGGVITEHVHPRQEERFTILAGQARFTVTREPDHLTAHLGPEPAAAPAVGAGPGLRHPPLLPALGQPDPGRRLGSAD